MPVFALYHTVPIWKHLERGCAPCCNPRYERGDAYKAICAALQDTASFSYPEDGVPYDVLLILRGCTGCPYLYEEIEAAHRVVVAAADEMPQAIDRIRSFTSQA